MHLTPDQVEAIEAARSTQAPTRRPVAPALEEILFTPFPVLDHGFVRVIDYMGDDQAIVQSARVSYGKGTKRVTADKGLIQYLMRHQHSTPFEMCEIKFHIKLPIFIARQWIRHRTANVNEYSARYSILDREFYLPETAHLATQSEINNQGRGAPLGTEESAHVLELLKRDAQQCFDTYDFLLNDGGDGTRKDEERTPLARELARMNLPLSTYTQWYWKIDLHNLFHFLKLRADSHAQYEIRAYAETMYQMVARWVPLAAEAFEAYRMGGTLLSKGGLEAVRRLIRGETVSASDVGLGAREWAELTQILGLHSQSSKF